MGEADPADLLPNPWNSNHLTADAERQLEESIARFGLFKPVIVREIEQSGEILLQIIGGEHRARAAERKKLASIPIVNLGRIDDQRAKEIGLVDNARYGADDAGQLAKLLKDIGDVSELQAFMPFTDEEAASIFAASSIDFDELKLEDEFDAEEKTPAIEEPRAPRVPRTHTVMRFKVALKDAERIAEIIAETQRDHGFTTADELTNAGDALSHLLLHFGSDDGE
jgi:hypothetical protein